MATSDLHQFNARMKALGKTVADNSDRLVRKCALAIDGAVILATPVDTGRARANWQVSLNEPISATRDPYAPGQAGSTGGPNAQAAIAQGQTVIQQYTFERAQAGLFITNNLPYIGRLNNGHSAQAPAGFVEKGIMVGVRAVREAGGVVKKGSP